MKKAGENEKGNVDEEEMRRGSWRKMGAGGGGK